MASRRKATSVTKKTKVPRKNNKNKKTLSSKRQKLLAPAIFLFHKIKQRRNNFVSRRPHRSFQLTRRRDYKRSLVLPGYWALTNRVRRILWEHKWLFMKFTTLYALLTGLVVGIMSQENYKLLNQTIQTIGDNAANGQLDKIGQNVVISAGVISGAFSAQPTQAQQVYGGLIFLLGWLSAIWLLRQVMAGYKNIRLRDALYSSAAPLLSTFLIFMVVLLQTIPFAIAVIAYVTAASINVFGSVLFSSLFWLGELLLVVFSLYWLSNSIIAFVVVTLPGMYPIKALKSASDLVLGRRLRLLYRLGWLLLSLVVIWFLVLVTGIAVSNISFLQNVPVIPLIVLLLSAFSLLWSSAYIYVLYRKLVDDGSPTV